MPPKNTSLGFRPSEDHGSSLLTLDKNTAAPTLIGETGSNATLNNGGLAYNQAAEQVA